MFQIQSSIKILFLSGLFAAAHVFLPSTASADEKYASIVIDAETDEVLHARFADDRRYPASLTKVMTLYMLFDAIKAGDISISERLKVSRQADRQPPSALGIRAGKSILVEDAIYALTTKSANDVAVVIAERIAGSEDRFATLMTVKARSLGLSNTSFYNASGLPDERQFTTARDMAKLAQAILEDHADYYHYFSKTQFRWGKNRYRNHNKLLGVVEGVDGIKTGYTRASGHNLMASAVRDDTRVIAIMLGGNSAKARNAHVTDLIEAAYTSINQSDDTLLVEDTEDGADEKGPQISFASLRDITRESTPGVAQSFVRPLEPIAQGAGDTTDPS